MASYGSYVGCGEPTSSSAHRTSDQDPPSGGVARPPTTQWVEVDLPAEVFRGLALLFDAMGHSGTLVDALKRNRFLWILSI